MKCMHRWRGRRERCSNAQCSSNEGVANQLRELRDNKKSIGDVPHCFCYRACPGCALIIEHATDCKHMQCRGDNSDRENRGCGMRFCFVCLKPKVNGEWQCGGYETISGYVMSRPCRQTRR